MTPALIVLAVVAAAAQHPHPDDVRTQAGALLDRNDYAGAAALLEKAAAAPSYDAEIYLMLAVARLNLAGPEPALEACERGMKAAPGSARLESYYADLLVQAAPKSDVAPRLNRALAARPASAVLQKALGKALLEASTSDPRAEGLLRSATQLLPRDPDAHYSYGQWACLHEKPALCIAEMHTTLALAPASNNRARLGANTFIGMTEESLGHFKEAGLAYRAALEANRTLTPFNADPAFLYVKFLGGRREDAAAAALVDEILERTPHFAPARFERAKALFRGGAPERAATEAETALQDSGEDSTALRAMHAFLVKTYSALGREEDAARHQSWVEANRR
jgi:predicted Zn-dependent protease